MLSGQLIGYSRPIVSCKDGTTYIKWAILHTATPPVSPPTPAGNSSYGTTTPPQWRPSGGQSGVQ